MGDNRRMAVASPTPSARALDARARRAARACGYVAKKMRAFDPLLDEGEYMLVLPEDHNMVVGQQYKVSAETLIAWCKADLKDRYMGPARKKPGSPQQQQQPTARESKPMNKQRRTALAALAAQLADAKEAIEALRDDEQEYFDNMPESLQGGEKGDMAQSAIEALDQACESIEAAIGSLEDAQE